MTSTHFKGVLAGMAAIAIVGTALAQSTPPSTSKDPATGAGQQSTQSTPMGSTGTPPGGSSSTMGASGTSSGTTGSTAASPSTDTGTSSSSSTTGGGSTMGASGSSTTTTTDTATSESDATSGKRTVRPDRN